MIRAKISDQDTQLNTISCSFLPKIKLITCVTKSPILAASSCTHMRICVQVGTLLVAHYNVLTWVLFVDKVLNYMYFKARSCYYH